MGEEPALLGPGAATAKTESRRYQPPCVDAHRHRLPFQELLLPEPAEQAPTKDPSDQLVFHATRDALRVARGKRFEIVGDTRALIEPAAQASSPWHSEPPPAKLS